MSTPKVKNQHIGKKPQEWYALEELFTEGLGIQPANLEADGSKVPIFIPGKLKDIPVVMVPMSASDGQIDAISKMIQEVLGRAAIIITSNVRFLRLVQIDPRVVVEAERLRKEGSSQNVQPTDIQAVVESPGDDGAVDAEGDGGRSITDGQQPDDVELRPRPVESPGAAPTGAGDLEPQGVQPGQREEDPER
jgi:hypothetical protein